MDISSVKKFTPTAAGVVFNSPGDTSEVDPYVNIGGHEIVYGNGLDEQSAKELLGNIILYSLLSSKQNRTSIKWRREGSDDFEVIMDRDENAFSVKKYVHDEKYNAFIKDTIDMLNAGLIGTFEFH